MNDVTSKNGVDRPKEDRLRVLMVTCEWPTPELPGRASFVIRQIDFLSRAGVDVEVFAFRGSKKVLNYLKAWRRLRRQLKERRYDLVHAQFGQSALLPWPKRLPLVVTFRGCELLGDKGPDGRTTWAGEYGKTPGVTGPEPTDSNPPTTTGTTGTITESQRDRNRATTDMNQPKLDVTSVKMIASSCS